MENQQANNLLFENVDINALKKKTLQDETKIKNIISDVHKPYIYLDKTYGLNRDYAKRFKHKLYNQYDKNLPNGYVIDPQFDKEKMKKAAQGSGNSQSILTKEDVLNIRNLKNVPFFVLANHYGVSRTTIHDIINRRSWTHI